jgi:hypothetical protein
MRCRTTLVFSTLVLALASPARAGIRYVNAGLSTGQDDGTSWADAFQGSNGLQAALAAAVAGDQVWAAQGSYKPTTGATRSISFVLRNGVEIYGGFAGTETSLGQRDFVAHVTILTGDLNDDDGSSAFADNSYHVLDAGTTNASAVIDGFHVRGGNANSTVGFEDCGGGILCVLGATTTVRNCVFRENRCIVAGGAGYFEFSSPTFTNCRFESNLSEYYGGALGLFTNSNARLTNCVLWNNTSTGAGGGGALYVSNSSPVIRQCIVAGNHSIVNPGAGIIASPVIALANDVIYFNQGPGGAQFLANNVSGGNCTFCCVQGIGSGAGNISANPLFQNLAGGDLHLARTSPCADAGNNTSVPTGTTTDIEGSPRFIDNPAVPDTGSGFAPIVDMGAYELPNTLYAHFCAGDGSLATACPCGNNAAPAGGRGCLNSDIFSPGALLSAIGLSNPDTVVLTSSEMLPSVTCIFLQGDQQNPYGAVFGDGVRCVAGSLAQLYVKSASGGTASAPGPGDPSISARSAALGDPIAPGTQRCYQVYYRDSNLAFCPAPQGDSWNVSSGLILNW